MEPSPHSEKDLLYARDRFHALLADSRTLEKHWQKLFADCPYLLSRSLPLKVHPDCIRPYGKPGQSVPDFVIKQAPGNQYGSRGVIEIKHAQQRLLASDPEGRFQVSGGAAKALGQVLTYGEHFVGPGTTFGIGDDVHKFIIMGLSEEWADGLQLDFVRSQLAGMFRGVRLFGFDEILKCYEHGLPQRTTVLIPSEVTPPWATSAGRDEFGRWADIDLSEGGRSHRVGGEGWRPDVIRFRYIKPGRFQMGSPEGEWGRFGDEDQHWVTLTEGFWIDEFPVTQGLWQVITGEESPSRFKGLRRPVETVSGEDAQHFIASLNERVSGLSARLPTEAQWENACRAGTRSATYAGGFDGENVDQVLNDIAWWSGNGGEQTHDVGTKRANAWGLHDMLGNVLEWCSEKYRKHLGTESAIDPAQFGTSGSRSWRVVRGGSWRNSAGRLRAACRDGDQPGHRSDVLGFRLSRGQ